MLEEAQTVNICFSNSIFKFPTSLLLNTLLVFTKFNQIERNMRGTQFHTTFISKHQEAQFISGESQMKSNGRKMAGPHMYSCFIQSAGPL